jgi:hypothetical protein
LLWTKVECWIPGADCFKRTYKVIDNDDLISALFVFFISPLPCTSHAYWRKFHKAEYHTPHFRTAKPPSPRSRSRHSSDYLKRARQSGATSKGNRQNRLGRRPSRKYERIHHGTVSLVRRRLLGSVELKDVKWKQGVQLSAMTTMQLSTS